jgi:hypothetical protein
MATTTYGTPYVAGTDLVANWPAASLTVANSIDAAGYYTGRGTNTQTASYTLVLTDAGKVITMALNTNTTITIPANASVAFPIGTQVTLLNLGSGLCTPTAGAGVTIAGTISALAINQFTRLIKTATNTWSYMPPGGFPASGTATVMTKQTTTSASYVDLATVGPQVTLTTGTKAFVAFACPTSNTTVPATSRIAVAISGATTVAASNDYSANCDLTYANGDSMLSKSFIFTCLTAGSNIFTLKYFTNTGTASFNARFLTVIDMGS